MVGNSAYSMQGERGRGEVQVTWKLEEREAVHEVRNEGETREKERERGRGEVQVTWKLEEQGRERGSEVGDEGETRERERERQRSQGTHLTEDEGARERE